jgi:predicted nuclease with TOPRIM domain
MAQDKAIQANSDYPADSENQASKHQSETADPEKEALAKAVTQLQAIIAQLDAGNKSLAAENAALKGENQKLQSDLDQLMQFKQVLPAFAAKTGEPDKFSAVRSAFRRKQ